MKTDLPTMRKEESALHPTSAFVLETGVPQFPNGPFRGFEAPLTSRYAGKCQFCKMGRKSLQNRMKVEIYINIHFDLISDDKFCAVLAEMNIEMTQNMLS